MDGMKEFVEKHKKSAYLDLALRLTVLDMIEMVYGYRNDVRGELIRDCLHEMRGCLIENRAPAEFLKRSLSINAHMSDPVLTMLEGLVWKVPLKGYWHLFSGIMDPETAWKLRASNRLEFILRFLDGCSRPWLLYDKETVQRFGLKPDLRGPAWNKKEGAEQ